LVHINTGKISLFKLCCQESNILRTLLFSFLFSPHGARVSGVVEETPGHLEYEVALYKEAPARINSNGTSELPVDQAVPIGTKLQLRARINPDSGWYLKPQVLFFVNAIF